MLWVEVDDSIIQQWKQLENVKGKVILLQHVIKNRCKVDNIDSEIFLRCTSRRVYKMFCIVEVLQEASSDDLKYQPLVKLQHFPTIFSYQAIFIVEYRFKA